MEVDSPVWYQVKSDSKWVAATIINKVRDISGNCTVTIRLNDSGMKYTKYLDKNDCNELTDIKLRNDSEEDCKGNMINLPHLNEATILHFLEARYYLDDIYTFTGRILVACNPLKKIPQLYTPQVLDYYYQNSLQKFNGLETDVTTPPLLPHVYAVVDTAYWNMMKAIKKINEANKVPTYSDIPSETYVDQTILISGESGSGKTETTKHALKYLTSISTPRKTFETEIILEVIMDRIIQSNPILEAFGNASTTRNENSSRFGKFIVMNFNNRGHLVGGILSTYLLEKVRITSQQRGERNFHIFYQLVSGCNEEERHRWFPNATATTVSTLLLTNNFYYLNQGQVTTSMHLEDDADNYILLKRALKILNFDTITQNVLLDAVIGILHLGQISFHSASTTHSNENNDTHPSNRSDLMVADNPTSSASLALSAKLFGVPVDSLLRAMTVRTIHAKWESYDINLTAIQAIEARDSLARILYDRIFSYLLVHINSSILVDQKRIRADIGILDIFGFESFKRNSFEQLCINYTNEMLQSQFNQHMFRAEQMEYESESLSSDAIIAFTDNQDCIELIANRSTGILGMLDDFCKLPKVTDDKFSQRLYKSFTGHDRFSASVLQKRDHQFCISHFAGPVVYSCKGFIEKNRNDIPKEATQLFGGSAINFLSSLFRVTPLTERDQLGTVAVSTSTSTTVYCQNPLSRSRMTSNSSPPASPTTTNDYHKSGNSSSVTIGSQFKTQLQQLSDRINSMVPHYIRCIKPNDTGIPSQFDQHRVAQQLRNSGVIDALRVARRGFPVRFLHKDFNGRYQSLLHIGEQLDSIVLCEHNHDRDRDGSQSQSVSQGKQQPLGRDMKLFSHSVKVMKEIQAAVFPLASTLLPSDIQVGTTKVFLTQRAHDILERCLQARRCVLLDRAVLIVQAAYRDFIRRVSYRNEVNRKRHSSATRLQSIGRMYICYYRYQSILSAILCLQYKYRQRLHKKVIAAKQLHKNIITLQRLIRGIVVRYHFLLYRKVCIRLQRKFRYHQSIRKMREIEMTSCSIVLQRVWRGVVGRRIFRQRHLAKYILRTKLVTLFKRCQDRQYSREKDKETVSKLIEKIDEVRKEIGSQQESHSENRKGICDDDNDDDNDANNHIVEDISGKSDSVSTHYSTTIWEDVPSNNCPSNSNSNSILVTAARIIPPLSPHVSSSSSSEHSLSSSPYGKLNGGQRAPDATVAMTQSLNGLRLENLCISQLSEEDTTHISGDENRSVFLEDVVTVDPMTPNDAIDTCYDNVTTARTSPYEEAYRGNNNGKRRSSSEMIMVTEAITTSSSSSTPPPPTDTITSLDVQVVFGCHSFRDLIDYHSDNTSSSGSSVDINLIDNDNDNDNYMDSEPKDSVRCQDENNDEDGRSNSDPRVKFDNASQDLPYLDRNEREQSGIASDRWLTYQDKVCCNCQLNTTGYPGSAYQFYDTVCSSSSSSSSSSLQNREIVTNYLNEIAALRRIIAKKDNQLYQLRIELADTKENFKKEYAALEGRMMGDILSFKSLYDIRMEEIKCDCLSG